MTSGRETPRIVGVALDAGRVYAAWNAAGTTARWERELDAAALAAEAVATLRAVFEELRERVQGDAIALHVALLPPLAQLRHLQLPRMRDDERRRVLTRDAARYFLGAREPQVIAASVLGARRGSPVPVLAAAAPASLVDAIFAAAESGRWEVESVRPAHEAWAAAVDAVSARASHAVFVHAETAWVLPLDPETPILRRCTTARHERLQHILEEEAAAPAAIVLGEPDTAADVADRLRGAGVEVLPTPGSIAGLSAGALAAVFAPAVQGAVTLLPERMHAARAASSRRLVRTLALAAAALVLVAGGARLWGMHRELDTVRGRRAELRARVTRALDARDTLQRLTLALETLAHLEASSPRWATVVAHVAHALPVDAHLTALRGSGDTLALEGRAARAADAFRAIGDAPGILSVRASAPIRQEVVPGQDPVERFALAARLAAAAPPRAIVTTGVTATRTPAGRAQ
jgi:hypothetical protein